VPKACLKIKTGLDQGQRIVSIATGVVDLFTPTPAQLQRREAEKKKALEDVERKRGTAEWYFKKQLDKYLVDAENGDDNARMSLITGYFRKLNG